MSKEPQAAGHAIVNPDGQRIRISRRTLVNLDSRGYLGRNRETGLQFIDARRFTLFSELEAGTPWFRELGPDCSGPEAAACNCRRCRAQDDQGDIKNESRAIVPGPGQVET